MSVEREQDIERRFKMFTTSPKNVHNSHYVWAIAAMYKSLAVIINVGLFEGREKSKALNRLEESMMWARESIEH